MEKRNRIKANEELIECIRANGGAITIGNFYVVYG